jgi:hypothetical protein
MVFTVEAPKNVEVIEIGLKADKHQSGNVLEQVQDVLIEIRTAQIGSAILDDETDKPAKIGIRKFKDEVLPKGAHSVLPMNQQDNRKTTGRGRS